MSESLLYLLDPEGRRWAAVALAILAAFALAKTFKEMR